jgi:hypothetical protein
MKNGLGLLVCALSLLAFASTAQSGGGEASGTFTFDLGTATGTTNFFGQLRKDGTVNGQISFNATVDDSGEACELVPVQSGDNTILVPVCEPTGITARTSVPLDFLIDCMVIANNRAAMSGTIVGDSPFAGLHTILAVENASGNDGFTWGVYKTKTVNTNAKDYDFCPNYTPPDCGELDCPPPPTGCINGQDPQNPSNTGDTGATLSWAATDYELCPYPPPSDTQNNVPPDPHNYVCFGGHDPDPNGYLTGIPVLATPAHTITRCDSFPLFTYPMTPVPHGGGNKVNVKLNS